MRPGLIGPSSTAHEYLSFPSLLCLPDENLPERGLGHSGLVDHLAELGSARDALALGFVHRLADDHVVVLAGVVSERPDLGRHGQVHPQTNGKLERYHQTIKRDVNQVSYEAPSDLDAAIAALVSYGNCRRDHMAQSRHGACPFLLSAVWSRD